MQPASVLAAVVNWFQATQMADGLNAVAGFLCPTNGGN